MKLIRFCSVPKPAHMPLAASILMLALPVCGWGQLTFAPSVVTGGGLTTGTVTTKASYSYPGTVVRFTSSQGCVLAPASVTVPVGHTTSSFSVPTTPVAKDTTATVTGIWPGGSASATLTVLAPTLSSFTASPNSVPLGKTAKVTLAISSAAPIGGLVIPVSGSSPLVTLPSTVTIAGGAKQVSFTVIANSTKSGTDTLTATLNGKTISTTLKVTSPYQLLAGWSKLGGSLANSAQGLGGGNKSEIVWSTATGAKTVTSPVLGVDTTGAASLVLGEDDSVAMHDAATGAKLWSQLTGGPVTSTPAIGQDGTVYAGSADGYLYAISSAGKQLWSYKVGSSIGSSPTLKDGLIFVGASDGYLYAVTASGAFAWKAHIGAPVTGSPAVGPDGTLYISAGKSLFALTPSGGQKWEFTSAASLSYPVLDPTSTTVYCTGAGTLYAVSTAGIKQWQSAADGLTSAPAVGSDGTVYAVATPQIEGFSYLLYFNPKGNLESKVQINSNSAAHSCSAPAIGTDGFVYCVIGFPSNVLPPTLHRVRPDSRISYIYLGNKFGAPASYITPCLGSDTRIYALGVGTTLYCVK